MTKLVPALLALLSFTGCTLIDQRTFAPSPEAKAAPAPPPVAVKLDARLPLVTIEYSIPNPDYEDLLNSAVRAAEMRDTDVQFDVVAVVRDASSIGDGQQRASGVMKAIMRMRVPDSRIHLGIRTDPTLPDDQVRVYVR